MMPQTPQPEPNTTMGFAAFEAIFTEVFSGHHAYKQSSHYALELGLDPDEIIAYARGDGDETKRRSTENMLTQVPWAMNRVIALVKARRDPASLGARLLRATKTDPYAWGVRNTGDLALDAANLLDMV